MEFVIIQWLLVIIQVLCVYSNPNPFIFAMLGITVGMAIVTTWNHLK